MESILSLLLSGVLLMKMFMRQAISWNTVNNSDISWKGPSLTVVKCHVAVIKLNTQHVKPDNFFALITGSDILF